MTRVATYARVSTDMQAEGGKSIAAQQAEMREFAAARGWEIVAEFVDPGYSGTTLDRPGLNALRAAAKEHAFDVLLVHELSRLSRRIFDTFRIFEELGREGIGFASVKEPNFDFSTPTGRLFLTILAALNQYYVDMLKMHTAKAKRERAREGLYNASITPYGYRHAGDANTPPVIVEEEAKVVREMFQRYATGRYSFFEIAEWLNDAGYRTRSGRRFSKDTVADMLRNPFYKGYVVYRRGSRDQSAGEIYPGKHEPIVSPELWEMCRRVREQRRTAPRTYQPKYQVYLLNGIATCDLCGRKLRAQGAKSGRYYREVSRQRGFTDCPVAGRGVRTEVIDRQVGTIFRSLRLPPDWQERLEELVETEDDR
ncbi:MAG TPA: recombinase family protein, partial [Thermoflexia bacterium]|nr:recombinase family protein [Thermoflexia bacterium]